MPLPPEPERWRASGLGVVARYQPPSVDSAAPLDRRTALSYPPMGGHPATRGKPPLLFAARDSTKRTPILDAFPSRKRQIFRSTSATKPPG